MMAEKSSMLVQLNASPMVQLAASLKISLSFFGHIIQMVVFTIKFVFIRAKNTVVSLEARVKQELMDLNFIIHQML
jgi:hypothetical protein